MGTGYKGDSKYYRSIGQNILPTSAAFEYSAGYFGAKSPYQHNNDTRNVTSPNPIEAATHFYDLIAYGGIEKRVTSNMRITDMADGSVVTMRIVSTSDGTPAVDINIKDSKGTGGVKGQKIHFVKED